MALTKLFVRVTDASLRDAVITKSNTDNKIYFLTTTHEIITHGVVYGLLMNIKRLMMISFLFLLRQLLTILLLRLSISHQKMVQQSSLSQLVRLLVITL